jgi:PAS domain S-box-containing protein
MSQFANDVSFGEGREIETQYPGLATVLLDSIPSSVLILDRSLRVTFANRNFLEKARRRAETTIGRRMEEVFPAAILDYTQLDQRARGVFQDGRSFDGGKMTYRAPSVPQRVYYYSLAPLRSGTLVAGVLLMMHDITEQERLTQDVRRAERHLASVVESANDLVVSMRPDGHIMTWNQAAERISGFPVGQVIGRDLAELCLPEGQEQMRALLNVVSQGESGKTHELNLRTRQGKVIPVAWACSPMWDEQGRVAALVAVGRDLTERHLLEAQLFQSAKMASLGVMAGGIAHQLRNPLGAASAAAQLMLRDPDNQELGRQCAQKIYEGIKRASAIIESLLRFARPDSGAFGAVQVNDVIEDTVAMLRHQANLGQVQVDTDLAPGLPLVAANASALQQVFTNLFLNACQAMPTGGRLAVQSRLADATQQIQIDFADTGCGIPPEDLNQVFDPFFTTRPVGQGVGLGLTIAYSIAQQHGGNIQVRSAVGVGSTFAVELPLHAAGHFVGGTT